MSSKSRHRGSRGSKKSKRQAVPLEQQAARWIQGCANRGHSKRSGKSLRSDRTVHRYQGDLKRAVQWIQVHKPLSSLKDITAQEAQAYLNTRAQAGLHRKTLQGYARALMTLPQINDLSISNPPQKRTPRSRAYTSAQIRCVQAHLPKVTQLAIQILWESGARVQDLASLRLAQEGSLQRARHHQLEAGRFKGREHWVQVQYIGKGGHHYLSAIHPDTARQLAAYRLSEPRDFRERQQAHPVCQQYYHLPAGRTLSDQWSRTARRILGYSHGVHGLRHTYAQQRLQELIKEGVPLPTAKRWVSQTLGHYRLNAVDVYLR